MAPPPYFEITGRRQDGATLARPPCRDRQPEPSPLPPIKNTEFFFKKKVSQNSQGCTSRARNRVVVCPADRQAGRQPCCSPCAERARKVPCQSCRKERNPSGRAFRAAISNKSCCHRYQVAFAICDRNCLHYFSLTGPPTIFSKERGVWWRCGLRSSRSFPWLKFFFSFFSFFLGLARSIGAIPLLRCRIGG